MYYFMLQIHIAGIVTCLYMLYLLLHHRGRQSNSFVVLAIVFNIMLLIGYVFELLSTNKDEMLLAIQIGYMGKCFAGVSFVTGIGKYYNWKYKRLTMPIFWGIGFFSFGIIMTAKYHDFYYTSVDMIWVDGHAFCQLGKAPYYVFFFAYLMFMFVYFAWRCLKYRRIAKTPEERSIMTVVGYGSIVAVMLVLGMLLVPTHYDFGPLVFAAYSLVFLYCILRYRLFDAVDMAIYQMAAENAQAILVTREDGFVEYANITAERILTWMNDLDKEQITERVREEFLSGKEQCTIGEREYQIAVSKVSDRGSVLGYAITLTDITRLSQYMDELERLSIKANEANKAKSNFLANMSHEIRTPINTMLGMNEMIAREAVSEEVVSYAQNIKEAGKSLLAIINDILDFSKIESGKMELVEAPYETFSVIRDLVNMIEIRAKEKGLAFRMEMDETLPVGLVGDDVRIRQILLNILSNAVKYTNEGSIIFRMNGQETEHGKYLLHVEVEDTGIGIKEEDREKIFFSFQRLEQKKNRNIEGTGLGMSITNSFLHMMGSKLSFESEYGKGSIFSFDLEQGIMDPSPLGDIADKIKAHREKKSQRGRTFTAAGSRVLVVDDNRMNLEVFQGLLKRTQIEIVTAGSGKEALEKIAVQEFDIIFMDHMMPEMDGIETYSEIRRRWREEPEHIKISMSVPVIIVTANAIYGAKEKYLQEGFSAYLSKPIDSERLEELLIEYLPRESVVFLEQGEGDEKQEHKETQLAERSLSEPKFQELRKYGMDIEEGWKHMGKSIETYEEILTIYFEELPQRIQRLKYNGTIGDMKAYNIDAHSLKSASGSIGATALFELAKMHENMAKQDDSLYVRQHLGRLCAECEKMIRAGKEFLEKSEV